MNRLQSKLSSRSYAKSMLMRDFISDCLYNKDYGYFSRNVNIFNTIKPIEFNELKDQDDYSRTLKDLYTYCEANDAKQLTKQSGANNNLRFNQLWHTPSELFKPFYGNSIVNFLLSRQVDEDALVIYEIGPGNGTLAENILDVLMEKYPKIYEGVEYNLIEISEPLKRIQATRLERVHGKKIRFPNMEILNIISKDDKFIEERPCWVLGMELLDNLSHDLIKFRTEDGALMESIVHVDPEATYGSYPGKYWQEFKESKDDLIFEYVFLADKFNWKWASLNGNSMRRVLERFSPIEYVNPWSCEYIPTSSFKLLKSLNQHFPRHQVLFSDFHELPDTVKGHSGPVVQTRFRGMTVPCSTVLLKPGLFDIFFPTNFQRLAQIHGKLRSNNNFKFGIVKHSDFMEKWSDSRDLERTTTKSGYNPMLQDFENVSFYYQVNT